MASKIASALWKQKPYWLKVELSNRYVKAKILRSHDGSPLASVTTMDPEVSQGLVSRSDKVAAVRVGQEIARKADELNIHGVGYRRPRGKRFHGKIASLLNAMVDSGLKLV